MLGRDRCRGRASLQSVGDEGDDLFNFFGFVAAADEEGVGGLDDDEIVDAEEGDGAWLVGEDEIIGGFDGVEGGIRLISRGIGIEVFGDGGPASDIIPIETGFDDEDAFGFFHDRVIDGDFWEGREIGGDESGEIFGGAEAADEFAEERGVAVEGGEDGGDGPDEHAGVPAEVALLEELFGEFGVGFFAEAGDFEDVGGVWRGLGE